jgi:hypothetical protein
MSEDILRRKVGAQAEDSHAIDNIEYNSFAGAQKNLEVGPALKYVDATAAEVRICPGDQLFLFKVTTGLGYVTLSKETGAVVGTAPAADTFPVQGQVYTPISAADYKYIIGTADIHLYVLRDSSQLRNNP